MRFVCGSVAVRAWRRGGRWRRVCVCVECGCVGAGAGVGVTFMRHLSHVCVRYFCRVLDGTRWHVENSLWVNFWVFASTISRISDPIHDRLPGDAYVMFFVLGFSFQLPERKVWSSVFPPFHPDTARESVIVLRRLSWLWTESTCGTDGSQGSHPDEMPRYARACACERPLGVEPHGAASTWNARRSHCGDGCGYRACLKIWMLRCAWLLSRHWVWWIREI